MRQKKAAETVSAMGETKVTIKLILPAKEVIINFLLRLIGINNQIIKIINFDVENIVSYLEGILVYNGSSVIHI